MFGKRKEEVKQPEKRVLLSSGYNTLPADHPYLTSLQNIERELTKVSNQMYAAGIDHDALILVTIYGPANE